MGLFNREKKPTPSEVLRAPRARLNAMAERIGSDVRFVVDESIHEFFAKTMQLSAEHMEWLEGQLSRRVMYQEVHGRPPPGDFLKPAP